MPTHSETRILSYTADQLFSLVMDMKKYPEFLPWCLDVHIKKITANNVESDITIGYKFFRENFSSRAHFESPKEIKIEYLKGPMRHLTNEWKFKNLEDRRCEVQFYVDFSLRSRFFNILIEQFFDLALKRMIHAFEARAEEVYGPKTSKYSEKLP